MEIYAHDVSVAPLFCCQCKCLPLSFVVNVIVRSHNDALHPSITSLCLVHSLPQDDPQKFVITKKRFLSEEGRERLTC